MAFPYKRIFAALDGSTTQEAVARRAVALAAHNKAELVFGHVVDSVSSDVNGANFDELCAEVTERLESDLADILTEARNSPDIPACSLEVRAGRVTDALVEQLIGPCNPDVVVCGERGLSDIKYAFVGSVSKHLIRTVRCDVLVVKQD